MGAELQPLSTEEDLESQETALNHARVLVDALLGTGLTSEVAGHYRRVLEWANRSPAIKVAVDIPSGLSADTGLVMGVALNADHTVTFGYPKVGLVTHPGVDRVGRLHVHRHRDPRGIEGQKDFVAELLEDGRVGRLLLDRPSWGHKGTYGHLLVIAGSPGRPGRDPLLRGRAPIRGRSLHHRQHPRGDPGDGEQDPRGMLAPLVPEGMEIDDSDEMFTHLQTVLEGKSAVAVGPGIPRGPGVGAFIARLVRESPIPVVVDADGLNELSKNLSAISEARAPILLTPHPGEMSTLTGIPVQAVQADRLNVAKSFAQKHRVFVALKVSEP